MTAPSLPAWFRVVTQGFQRTAAGGTFQTPTAGGNVRIALAYDRGQAAYSVSLFHDAEGIAIWELFYAHAIKKGAISFYIPIDSGFGVAPHLSTMTSLPVSTPLGGGRWQTAFNVIAEPGAYAASSAEAAEILAMYESYGPGLEALLDRLEQFVSQDLEIELP